MRLELNIDKYAWWIDYKIIQKCMNCGIHPICYGRKYPSSYYNPESCKRARELNAGIIKAMY